MIDLDLVSQDATRQEDSVLKDSQSFDFTLHSVDI